MINTIPRIYPNETLYSWLYRYHTINGNLNSQKTFEELFNRTVVNLNLIYPTYLDCLISKLPNTWHITADELIEHHTVFPFFKPFLTLENINKAVNCMKTGDTSKLVYHMGIKAEGRLEKRVIRRCPICDEENIKKYGEAYLIKNHQIPGNYFCTKHKMQLKEYIVPDRVKNTEFINIHDCHCFIEHKNEDENKELYSLSKAIDSIMSGALNKHDIELIKEKYRMKMQIEGYMSLNGRVGQQKLIKDFLDYYSTDLLSKLGSNIDVNKEHYWVKLMVYKSYNYPIHPIRHLLFIRFLFGELEELISFDEKFLPFGEGPWLCLNPVADHYNKPVIEECNIKKGYKGKGNNEILGTFKCKCGFEYTMRCPKSKEELYKNMKVIKFGCVWEEKLRELLIDKEYSLKEVAKIMGTNKTTVRKYGEKIKNELGDANIGKKDNTSELLEIYKEDIREAISKNKKMTRTQVWRKLRKQCSYLRENDPDWMENNLPKRVEYVPTNEGWIKRDKELRTKVLVAIEQILKEEGKPKKVSLAYIAKKVDYSGIRSNKLLQKLPLTKKAIEDNRESIEDYKRRCINYAIDTMIENKEPLTLTTIASKVNYKSIGYERMQKLFNDCLKNRV